MEKSIKILSDPPKILMISDKAFGTSVKSQKSQVVYAYNRQDASDVYAVKIIDRTLCNERELQNVHEELSLMEKIHSPNVCRLKEVTKTKSNVYLALELCNGGSLQNFLKASGGRIPELTARIFLKQIVRGLTAIREQDAVHRDLGL